MAKTAEQEKRKIHCTPDTRWPVDGCTNMIESQLAVHLRASGSDRPAPTGLCERWHPAPFDNNAKHVYKHFDSGIFNNFIIETCKHITNGTHAERKAQ